MATAEADLPLTPKQEARRRRVMQAALDLGAEGGYDAVQMREVAATANVALGTIYRYFSSKDHLLAAAMAQWTGELRARLTQLPPKGDSRTDQLLNVLRRACRSMERQPKLTAALVMSLAAPDAGVETSAGDVREQIAMMAGTILDDLDPDDRATILSIVGHVWYSTLTAWANGRRPFSHIYAELERAVRFLLAPYDAVT
jgi:TetR/AcrR family transcriptional regulator, cholesterol catabolism regulator